MIDALAIGSNQDLELTDSWEYAVLQPGTATNPQDFSNLKLNWQAAVVPGTVAGAELIRGDFEYGNTDYDSKDYWYRCTITLPEAPLVHLNFAGLATLAEVFWNDVHILSSNNMFEPHSIDVSHLPRVGTLWIRFCALNEALKVKRPRPKWRTKLVDNQQLRWFRKTLLGRIPTWSPPVSPVGPWRGVWAKTYSSALIDQMSSCQTFNPETGTIAFTLGFRITKFSDSKLDEVCLFVGDRRISLAITQLSTHQHEAKGSVTIEPEDFWWPHTHGNPKLFKLALSYLLDDKTFHIDLGHTGFRHVTVDQSDDKFIVSINGQAIFCRGACWTPLDVINYGPAKNELTTILTAVRDAGMNTIRLVGSMIYESDAFYQLCDQLGILVWQDFIFSNLDYPFDDDSFKQNVMHEATYFLKKVSHNPCLIVVCGNSDVEQQTSMLGLPPNMWRPSFFADELPLLVKNLRPDAIYLPSSPSGGDLPFEADKSVSHYYGVGAYLRPLSDARLADVKFAAECLGFANIPEQSTIYKWLSGGEAPTTHPKWKERVPRDGGASWDFDDVRDHYLKLLFEVDPNKLRYCDLERYLALSRVTSGEVMLRTIQEWRRVGSNCYGALVWWLRDLWPGPGWGVIDAYNKPKSAYYFLRRAMAPTTVFFTDEGLNGLNIHAINESRNALRGVVELDFLSPGGINSGHFSTNLDCGPNGKTALRVSTITKSFNDSSYAYRFGPPGHTAIRAKWISNNSNQVIGESFHFPAGYNLQHEGDIDIGYAFEKLGLNCWELTLTTKKLAQYVHIEIDDADLSDNYFHLFPGSKKTLIIQLTNDISSPTVRISALNFSRQLTIRAST